MLKFQLAHLIMNKQSTCYNLVQKLFTHNKPPIGDIQQHSTEQSPITH